MVSTKILIHGHPPPAPLRTGFARAVESLADRQLKYAPQGSIPPQSERRRSLYTGSDIRCSDYYSMTIHQGEGPPVCYDVEYMDCTVHGTGASKFPLLQQENLTIDLLRAV
jgi:hypothetical protein